MGEAAAGSQASEAGHAGSGARTGRPRPARASACTPTFPRPQARLVPPPGRHLQHALQAGIAARGAAAAAASGIASPRCRRQARPARSLRRAGAAAAAAAAAAGASCCVSCRGLGCIAGSLRLAGGAGGRTVGRAHPGPLVQSPEHLHLERRTALIQQGASRPQLGTGAQPTAYHQAQAARPAQCRPPKRTCRPRPGAAGAQRPQAQRTRPALLHRPPTCQAQVWYRGSPLVFHNR